MNCLLVAATAKEIEPFIANYHTSDKRNYIEFNLHILITGVGMVATTYKLTDYFKKNKPDIVLMVGIAGCYKTTIPLGTVYAVKNETFGDLGVLENNSWIDVFDLKLILKNTFPFKNKKLENTNKIILERTGLTLVNAITVNQITTSKKQISIMEKKYKPFLESMEGAALHYVCLHENVPFVQIRGVSNYIGERNKKNWKIKEAIQNSNNIIINLFESL
jgi:futalosine hydrolase